MAVDNNNKILILLDLIFIAFSGLKVLKKLLLKCLKSLK